MINLVLILFKENTLYYKTNTCIEVPQNWLARLAQPFVVFKILKFLIEAKYNPLFKIILSDAYLHLPPHQKIMKLLHPNLHYNHILL